MSLDIWLKEDLYDKHGRLIGDRVVFQTNITHNLGKMAQACGLYNVMWKPEELDYEFKVARDLQRDLIAGINYLVDKQDELEKYNPENGWGNYDNLLDVAIEYLCACLRYPNAEIGISR